jgi:FtsP/CotA-like multicopper oxidase with cupredoxin domain
MLRLLVFLLLALGDFAAAKDVVYDFNVTWVTANPDGLADRKVVGINGQWPLPVIEVDKGDQLIVNMYNGLGDKSTSIHFHGMFQNGTNDMDGASMVTQCPIPPGSSFTYNFTVNQNGTYWYHCHTVSDGQMIKSYMTDGLNRITAIQMVTAKRLLSTIMNRTLPTSMKKSLLSLCLTGTTT